jgi:hypothetical protein
VVRTYHEDGSRTDTAADDIKLYTGHVTGHPGSKVVVKDNNGLVGIIPGTTIEFVFIFSELQ